MPYQQNLKETRIVPVIPSDWEGERWKSAIKTDAPTVEVRPIQHALFNTIRVGILQATAANDFERIGHLRRATLKAGVAGWSGVTGRDGKPIEFKKNEKTGEPDDECLVLLEAKGDATSFFMQQAVMTYNEIEAQDLGN